MSEFSGASVECNTTGKIAAAKVASIIRKYGDRLSEEQKADIRRIMAETQEGLEKMRAFVLENGDQPADAFRAWRSESEVRAKDAPARLPETRTGNEKK